MREGHSQAKTSYKNGCHPRPAFSPMLIQLLCRSDLQDGSGDQGTGKALGLRMCHQSLPSALLSVQRPTYGKHSTIPLPNQSAISI